MTDFKDFKPFFDAMIKEMQRHDPKYGDSWKERGFYVSRGRSVADPDRWVDMDNHLKEQLKNAVGEYFEGEFPEDPPQLIDIANICAMMWLRFNILEEKVK